MRGCRLASCGVMLLLLLAIVGGRALARSGYVSDWNTLYPGSSSLSNVDNGTGSTCQFCHRDTNGGNGWNGYGWNLRQEWETNGRNMSAAMVSCEPLDSDLDPANFINYGPSSSTTGEIDSDTQPGWTGGTSNTIYFKDGTTQGGQAPPAGILGDLDPTLAAQAPGETLGLLVTAHDKAGGVLTVTYDNSTCSATDNNLYFGPLDQVASYIYSGQDCGIGNGGSYDWTYPATSAYFLIVASDGTNEGSYGTKDESGVETERPPAGTCPVTQDLPNRCDPAP